MKTIKALLPTLAVVVFIFSFWTAGTMWAHSGFATVDLGDGYITKVKGEVVHQVKNSGCPENSFLYTTKQNGTLETYRVSNFGRFAGAVRVETSKEVASLFLP